ncbi:MAG TPA: transglutaminase-like domain-containing protein [Gammaproteobacteria bacterium]
MNARVPAMTEARPVQMPPLGLAAALLLWGMANQVWPYALVMALVLEGARWVPWRWHLSDRDFNRLADASGLGLLIVVLYVFDAHSFQGVYVILQWLPFVLFLLALGQRYSTRTSIRYAALFLSVRRAERKGTVSDGGEINFDLPYFVVCLASATGGDIERRWLFAGLAAVVIYLLWYNRPRRVGTGTWLSVAGLVLLLAYLNQIGMFAARRVIEPAVMDFFRERIMHYRDPFSAHTAMGHIGRLKQSDRIVLRVTDVDGEGVPVLLREATYRDFSKNIWMAGKTAFQEQIPDFEGTTWALESYPGENSRRVRVARSLIRDKGLLVVPPGTFQIEQLPVEQLERHPLGALKVNRGPGLINYVARYAPDQDFDLPPSPEDLVVPRDLGTLMNSMVEELGLQDAAPHQALRKIHEFFLTGFTYAVTLKRPGLVATPLHGFLLTTRTGHCEFFASATVMMLRALGIPARYATGYAVHEYSPLEKSFVVRRRHAHSWALAYVGGRWIDFDTTPPHWRQLEAEAAAWWENVYDVVAWLLFRFSRWRWSADEEEASENFLWLVIPLFVILVWRLSRTERVSRRRGSVRDTRLTREKPGDDSDFYAVLRVLERHKLKRPAGEPVFHWLSELDRRDRFAGVDELVRDILPLHYRYRFDPRGINPGERRALRERVRNWLARHPD